MNNVAVKICGLTNLEDASSAVELGAGALGFIFAPSPRQVKPDKVRSIIRAIPPFVKTVGVFVNEGHAAIGEIQRYCGLDLVQLHGNESPVICQELMPYTIKAFRPKNEKDLSAIRPYVGKIRALLFDTYSEKKRGGTGKTFDWNLALKGKELGVPIILSGGLNPSNIEQAISMVRPFAVDVNSGVEEGPAKKSHTLMKKLMESIKGMNHGGLI